MVRSNGSVYLVWEEDNLMDAWGLVLGKPVFAWKERTNPLFKGAGLCWNSLLLMRVGDTDTSILYIWVTMELA